MGSGTLILIQINKKNCLHVLHTLDFSSCCLLSITSNFSAIIAAASSAALDLDSMVMGGG